MDAHRWREGWQEFAGNIEVFRVAKVEESFEELQKDLKILSKVKQDIQGRLASLYWLSDGL